MGRRPTPLEFISSDSIGFLLIHHTEENTNERNTEFASLRCRCWEQCSQSALVRCSMRPSPRLNRRILTTRHAVQKGLAISPVPLDFTGRDRNQVGYGSYLVNAAGGCNDCHTNPNYQADGDPFKGMAKKVNAAGFMAGGIAFGPFTSRNITPSVEGPVTGQSYEFQGGDEDRCRFEKASPANLDAAPGHAVACLSGLGPIAIWMQSLHS